MTVLSLVFSLDLLSPSLTAYFRHESAVILSCLESYHLRGNSKVHIMELQQNHIFINLKVEIYKYQVVDNTGFKISVIYRNQDKLKFTSLNALKMSLRVYNLNF